MARARAGQLGTLVRERPSAPAGAVERFWAESMAAYREAAAGRAIAHDLVLAGVPFRLEFAGPAMHEVVFPPFGHLARHDAAEPDRRVLVWDTASTGVEAPDPIWTEDDIGPLEEVLSLVETPIRAAADRAFGGRLVYDTRSRTLLCHAPDAARIPSPERAAPMRAGLHWLLTGPGRHLIHGAAVGEDGRGLLIAAPSGGGKSTLAVACLQAGLDVAADDFVLVTTDGPARAHSLYATAKLDRASLALLVPDERLVTNPGFADHEKAVLDLRSEGIVTDLPVSAIVVPQRVPGARPRLERISGGEALRQLGPSSVVVMPRPRGAAFATAGELARRLPAWRLALGEDLPAAVGCLRDLLAEVGEPAHA